MKRQHPIKSLLNFRTLTAEVVLSTSTHIFTEIYNNPNYTPPQAPAPPVDPATLKSANDSLAVAIASSCSERELIQLGGRVGSTLYTLSREPAARAVPSSSYGHRKPITLSTKPLSTLAPIEDEFDDEAMGEAVTA